MRERLILPVSTLALEILRRKTIPRVCRLNRVTRSRSDLVLIRPSGAGENSHEHDSPHDELGARGLSLARGGRGGLMKMADNHIRLESSPWPDPLSQASLRPETNERERRPRGWRRERRDRRCWRMGSSFEYPSSRALQFLSSRPLLFAYPYSRRRFLVHIYPYALHSRGFP